MKNLRDIIQSQFDLFKGKSGSLEQIVNDYPASSLARLLLAKKYKETDDPHFEEFKRESALFMGNIPWYLFVLSDNKSTVQPVVAETTEGTAELSDKDTVAEEKISVSDEYIEAAVDSPENTTNTAPVENAVAEVEEIQELSDFVEDKRVEEEATDDQLPVEENPDLKDTEDTSSESPVLYEIADEDVSEEMSSVDRAISEYAAAIADGDEAPDTVAVDETHEDAGETEENVATHDISDDNETAVVDAENGHGSFPVLDEEHVDKAVPEKPSNEELSAPILNTGSGDEITQGQPVLERQGKQVAGELDFEPLYTRDYFASQGIRLEEKDLSDDRLSQQVRSFTGWLRSMKKLHPGRFPEQHEVIEKIIRDAAEMSNVGPNVLTEAMAEVLVKQNKKDQAVEMYQKLSLMNPAKSAYFAAKIEKLKTF